MDVWGSQTEAVTRGILMKIDKVSFKSDTIPNLKPEIGETYFIRVSGRYNQKIDVKLG